ncbi:TonB-dependent receptor, partial [candidate division KSB1 bacterium]|nr:TonB-dependent receptor [candidate division KSB1 bacterium]
MKTFIYLLIIVCCVSSFFQAHLYGQKTKMGVMQGRVVNANTNEALPGVNIILLGTVMGASTDLDGNFYLDKIPVGSYQIKATMMGYKPQTQPATIGTEAPLIVNFKLIETMIEVPGLVITASKRQQSVQESSTSLSVVTSKQIERMNEAYLDQSLKNAPGVYFTVNNVNIRGSSGFSRGAGSRVLMLVDGIPMMPGDAGDIKWDVIPAKQVKQVEIVKGAGSALYGSFALGGIINVITREPSDKPETNVRLAAGIHDQPYWSEWRWTDRTLHFSHIDVSHSRTINQTNFLIALNRRQDTGYGQNSHFQTWGGLGTLRYSFSPQTYWVFNSRYTYRKAGELLLWRNQHDALLVAPENLGHATTSSKFNASSIFRKVLTQKVAYKVQAALLRNWWRTDFKDHIDESTANNLRVETQVDLEPFARHSVTTGVELVLDRVEANIFGDHHATGGAFYLQDELKIWQPVAITGGMRFDLHQVDQKESEQEWSPKLGLVYRPTLVTALRTSVGHGFRAPTMAERFTSTIVSGFQVVPNPNLTAERSWSYEVGLNQVVSENVLLDAAIFRTDYWDLIEGQPDATNTIRFENLTRAQITGVEA